MARDAQLAAERIAQRSRIAKRLWCGVVATKIPRRCLTLGRRRDHPTHEQRRYLPTARANTSVTLVHVTSEAQLPGQMPLKAADDQAGARTQSRYTYQANWALWSILDRLRTQADFAFVFEHQDDILVFDSPAKPHTVDAFQVKTSTKTRPSRRTLLHRKRLKDGSGHAFSILGKLFRSRLKFASMSRHLAIVSNLPFNIRLKDRTTDANRLDEIPFEQLTETEQRAITAQLKDEHALEEEPTLEHCMTFIRARLTLTSHRNDALAKLIEVVEEKYPASTFRPSPLYATLMEEIRRKVRTRATTAATQSSLRTRDSRGQTSNDVCTTHFCLRTSPLKQFVRHSRLSGCRRRKFSA